MAPSDLLSRRATLKRLAGTGALVGVSIGGLSSVSADDHTADPAADGGEPSLVPVCVDPETNDAVFCVTNDHDRAVTLEWQVGEDEKVETPDPDPVPEPEPEPEPEELIEFVDCQTIRVVGDFVDVGFEATFIAADGEIGNVIEFVGPVDGETLIDITDVDTVPDDAISGFAEAFRADTPVTPGGGDISTSNPQFDACQLEFFGEIILGAAADTDATTDTDADNPATDETTVENAEATTQTAAIEPTVVDAALTDDEPLPEAGEEFSVPAGGAVCFVVPTEDGSVTVALLEDGTVIDEQSSDPETECQATVRDAVADSC